jgi:hypothetical protein
MRKFQISLIAVLCASSFALADSGKISGRVVDEKGDGIYGACVLIVETQQGACVQSLDGSYVIIGVPPGIYTVRIYGVQYVKQTFTNVSVAENETTILGATLTEAVLQGVEQIIVWERPNVKLETHPKAFISDGNWGLKYPRIERVNTIGVPAHILVQYKIPARVRYR